MSPGVLYSPSPWSVIILYIATIIEFRNVCNGVNIKGCDMCALYWHKYMQLRKQYKGVCLSIRVRSIYSVAYMSQ